MLSRHTLLPEDLAGLIAAVFAYNQRGNVVGVNLFDEMGHPVKLGYAEAITEGPGLRVRQEPDESPEDKLKRLAVGAEQVTDPRAVAGPTPLADLAAATGEVA